METNGWHAREYLMLFQGTGIHDQGLGVQHKYYKSGNTAMTSYPYTLIVETANKISAGEHWVSYSQRHSSKCIALRLLWNTSKTGSIPCCDGLLAVLELQQYITSKPLDNYLWTVSIAGL